MPLMKTRHKFALTGSLLAAIFGVWLGSSIERAGAAEVPVIVETLTPQVERGEDGKRTLDLNLSNLTGEPIEVVAFPTSRRADCQFAERKLLGRPVVGEMTVTLGDRCEPDEKLTVKAAGYGPCPFLIEPIPPKPDPEWDDLAWGFGGGAVLSLFLLIVIYAAWTRAGLSTGWPNQPLKHIGTTWKFKDNWATDVTALAALFTGVFGTSTVVKEIAGEKGEAMLGLSTVGSAIAVALVAFSPLVILATKQYREDGEPVENFTVGGVLAGAFLVLTSAFAQIYVIFRTGQSFDMNGVEDWIWPAFVFAALLLVVYAWRSLTDVLFRGTTAPPGSSPGDSELAARIIARPLWIAVGRNPEQEFMRGSSQDDALKKAAAATAALEAATTAFEAAVEAAVAVNDAEPWEFDRKMRFAERAIDAWEIAELEAFEAVGAAEVALDEAEGDEVDAGGGETIPSVQYIAYPGGATSPGDDRDRSALL